MPEEFGRLPFVPHLESRAEAIRREAARIPIEDYRAWPLQGAYRGGWKLFCLFSEDPDWLYAAGSDANARRCPQTLEAMKGIPGLMLGGFSLLLPDTHIYRHKDELSEDCLRCHLTLSSNEGSALRIEDEVVPYEAGRCVVFHGETEHESINRGDTPRVVLLVDVRRSQVHEEIEQAVSA